MRLATAFDGQFYPAGADQLAACVDDYLAGASRPEGDLLGVVVPHAGYVYSGRTAGAAIGMFQQAPPELIVLLGPSHRIYFEGVKVFELEGYETPLGPVAGAPELAREIARHLGEEVLHEGFPEHSVEVQLPLLARALPGVPVLQIVLGDTSEQDLDRLVSVLLELQPREHFAVVASSDLSHFHDRNQARRLDDRFRVLLESGDVGAMRKALVRGETEACGSGAVLALMEMARRRGARIQTVDQTDSSEASGDRSQVVGYLSAAVLLVEGRG